VTADGGVRFRKSKNGLVVGAGEQVCGDTGTDALQAAGLEHFDQTPLLNREGAYRAGGDCRVFLRQRCEGGRRDD
jgi:hypothetical protein